MDRVLQIHARLSQDRSASAQQLAEWLEVNARTIRRDIALLRDRFGAPVVCDRSSRTYFYESPCEILPLLRLGPDEKLSMAFTEAGYDALEDNPFAHSFKSAKAKFERLWGDAVASPSTAITETVLMPSKPTALMRREYRCYTQAFLAAFRRRVLSVVYRKPQLRRDAPDPEPRRLHALHVFAHRQRLVLIAYDPGTLRVQTFKLIRMISLEETGERFTPPAGFDIRRLRAGSMGLFMGDEVHEIRVLLDPEVVALVEETPWHTSQRLDPQPDGRYLLSLTLNNLIDVRRALLEHAPLLEVLAPPQLRDMMIDTGRKLMARHAGVSVVASPPVIEINALPAL